MRSSRVKKCARSTVKRGVLALRMAARPLPIVVWPHRIRLMGMALLRRPMTANARQARIEPGISCPAARTTTWSTSAARPRRPTATVNGGSWARATLPKK
jgi:hypothetical protein